MNAPISNTGITTKRIWEAVGSGRLIRFVWNGKVYLGRPVLERGYQDTFNLEASPDGQRFYNETALPIWSIPFREVEYLAVIKSALHRGRLVA